jgi:hypothetical protein
MTLSPARLTSRARPFDLLPASRWGTGEETAGDFCARVEQVLLRERAALYAVLGRLRSRLSRGYRSPRRCCWAERTQRRSVRRRPREQASGA